MACERPAAEANTRVI